MTNYIKYKNKFWKVVSNKNGRYYLVPKKGRNNYKNFRSLKNLKKFGYSKKFRSVLRNQRKRNMLRGGAVPTENFVFDYNDKKVPLQENNKFVTDDDQKWINELKSPRDKTVANKALKQLNDTNRLLRYFGGNEGSFETLDQAVAYLSSNKNQVLQRIFENGIKDKSFGGLLKETFSGIGNRLLNLVGVTTGPGSSTSNSAFDPNTAEKASRALDELISNLKTKALNAQNTLQQLYLKQGDREEQQQIREDEDKKQEKIRKEERVFSTPKYQVVRNLNPLGFGVSQSRRAVDPQNQEQVREVRQNPVVRRIDPSYFSNGQNKNIVQRREEQEQLRNQSSW
jgi:hypothetical protein